MAELPVKALEASHMSLYPTKDSLVEAVEYIEAQAPIEPSQVFALLMTYHNTLLAELAKAGETNVIPLSRASRHRQAP